MSNSEKTFIALSDFIQQHFQTNYHIRPFATVPLGICTGEFNSGEKIKDIDILAAGSLIPLKQFEIVLKITAALKNNFENIQVMICGDGPELVNLKNLAAELGIPGNVQFTGVLPHSEVLNLMQRSKIFLHPSSYEGFGMVCAEALYAGAQVISFCQPMHAVIKNWHIASGTAAMLHIAEKLLRDLPVPEKLLLYSSDDTAHAVIKLFGWQAAD